MDTVPSKERRKDAQRRLSDFGPPQGVAERRINIERRLFNLSFDPGSNWGRSPNTGSGHGHSAGGC